MCFIISSFYAMRIAPSELVTLYFVWVRSDCPTLSVHSCLMEGALADEVEVAAPIHLSPQHFQFEDLPLDLPLAPRERQSRPHRCKVLAELDGEGGELGEATPGRVRQPAVQPRLLPPVALRADQGGETVEQGYRGGDVRVQGAQLGDGGILRARTMLTLPHPDDFPYPGGVG